MRSRACFMVIFVGAALAVVACVPPESTPAQTREAALGSAYRRLSLIDGYAVGAVSYQRFRRVGWPSFTILHMDVRSGPVEHADAVVVLGVAGGEATSPGGAESLVSAVLEQAMIAAFASCAGGSAGSAMSPLCRRNARQRSATSSTASWMISTT